MRRKVSIDLRFVPQGCIAIAILSSILLSGVCSEVSGSLSLELTLCSVSNSCPYTRSFTFQTSLQTEIHLLQTMLGYMIRKLRPKGHSCTVIMLESAPDLNSRQPAWPLHVTFLQATKAHQPPPLEPVNWQRGFNAPCPIGRPPDNHFLSQNDWLLCAE